MTKRIVGQSAPASNGEALEFPTGDAAEPETAAPVGVLESLPTPHEIRAALHEQHRRTDMLRRLLRIAETWARQAEQDRERSGDVASKG